MFLALDICVWESYVEEEEEREREDGRCPVLSANFSFHRNIDHSFLCWSYIFSCSPQVHLLHPSFCWSIFHPVDLLSSSKKKLLSSDASFSIPRKSEHREQREDAQSMHTTDSQAFSRTNSASGLLGKIHEGVKDVKEMLSFVQMEAAIGILTFLKLLVLFLPLLL